MWRFKEKKQAKDLKQSSCHIIKKWRQKDGRRPRENTGWNGDWDNLWHSLLQMSTRENGSNKVCWGCLTWWVWVGANTLERNKWESIMLTSFTSKLSALFSASSGTVEYSVRISQETVAVWEEPGKEIKPSILMHGVDHFPKNMRACCNRAGWRSFPNPYVLIPLKEERAK